MFDQVFSISGCHIAMGLHGNARLRYVHGQFAQQWVDTSDVSPVRAQQQVQKRLGWRSGRSRLVVAPVDHATYVRHVEDQWNYGYQRGMEVCSKRQSGDKLTMRRVDHYNRAES